MKSPVLIFSTYKVVEILIIRKGVLRRGGWFSEKPWPISAASGRPEALRHRPGSREPGREGPSRPCGLRSLL